MTGAAGAVHPAAAPAGRTFDVRRLGRMGYDEAVALQAALVEERRAGVIGDTLLFVEHPPVITLGVRTRTGASHIVASASELEQRGVLVRETGRGGDVTYHGPGQLVGYPIVKLPMPIDAVGHVRRMEQALIGACAEVGVRTGQIAGRSGVWVLADDNGPDRKVAAIGVRISRCTTMHGFALNCDPDLSWFGRIVPCGIDDAEVTSLSAELGRDVTVEEMLPIVESHLTRTVSVVAPRVGRVPLNA